MFELRNRIQNLNASPQISKKQIVDSIDELLVDAHFTIVERHDTKPWGAYIRISSSEAHKFIKDFFPGLSLKDAQLGVANAELSPKVLIVSPGQRLSWQYHNRRAERWSFITPGLFNKSQTDDLGDVNSADTGEVVQFLRNERHRLVGRQDGYTIVAEIWQHTEANEPSDENDIIRLADDYKR